MSAVQRCRGCFASMFTHFAKEIHLHSASLQREIEAQHLKQVQLDVLVNILFVCLQL